MRTEEKGTPAGVGTPTGTNETGATGRFVVSPVMIPQNSAACNTHYSSAVSRLLDQTLARFEHHLDQARRHQDAVEHHLQQADAARAIRQALECLVQL